MSDTFNFDAQSDQIREAVFYKKKFDAIKDKIHAALNTIAHDISQEDYAQLLLIFDLGNDNLLTIIRNIRRFQNPEASEQSMSTEIDIDSTYSLIGAVLIKDIIIKGLKELNSSRQITESDPTAALAEEWVIGIVAQFLARQKQLELPATSNLSVKSTERAPQDPVTNPIEIARQILSQLSEYNVSVDMTDASLLLNQYDQSTDEKTRNAIEWQIREILKIKLKFILKELSEKKAVITGLVPAREADLADICREFHLSHLSLFNLFSSIEEVLDMFKNLQKITGEIIVYRTYSKAQRGVSIDREFKIGDLIAILMGLNDRTRVIDLSRITITPVMGLKQRIETLYTAHTQNGNGR